MTCGFSAFVRTFVLPAFASEHVCILTLVSQATGVADSSSFDTNPAASDAQDQTDGGKKAGRNSRRGRKAQGALNGHGSEVGYDDISRR